MSYLTPNLSLLGISIGVDSGLVIETNYNANVAIIDQHNHSPGQGVQINPTGININSDLPFNNNNAITLRSARFSVQSALLSGAADLGCLYVSGVDLYYNDVAGNQIKITSGGTVFASSSGISSGSATAAFSGGVLVVNSAALTPANIQAGSILLGNNTSGTNYLTLSPPSAMGSSYGLVLPPNPAGKPTSFMQLDAFGNMTASVAVANGITDSNIALATITGSNIALATITGSNIAAGAINTTQLADFSVTASILSPSNLFQPTFNSASATSTTPTTMLSSQSFTSNGRPILVNVAGLGGANTGIFQVTTSGSGSVGARLRLSIHGGGPTGIIQEWQTTTQGVSSVSPVLGIGVPLGMSYIFVLSAGTYLFDLDLALTNGSGNAVISAGILSFVNL